MDEPLFGKGVTELAVLRDGPAVGGPVTVVVAAEAAGSVDVPDVAGISAPRDVHGRKDVLCPDCLRRRNRIADERRGDVATAGIETSQAIGDRSERGLAVGVGRDRKSVV